MAMDFPKEFLIRLDGESFLEGRLTLHMTSKGLNVEIALVQKESRKIHRYIDTLGYFEDEREAIDRGVSRLSQFLSSLRS